MSKRKRAMTEIIDSECRKIAEMFGRITGDEWGVSVEREKTRFGIFPTGDFILVARPTQGRGNKYKDYMYPDMGLPFRIDVLEQAVFDLNGLEVIMIPLKKREKEGEGLPLYWPLGDDIASWKIGSTERETILVLSKISVNEQAIREDIKRLEYFRINEMENRRQIPPREEVARVLKMHLDMGAIEMVPDAGTWVSRAEKGKPRQIG